MQRDTFSSTAAETTNLAGLNNTVKLSIINTNELRTPGNMCAKYTVPFTYTYVPETGQHRYHVKLLYRT